jgi:hypothetical protein
MPRHKGKVMERDRRWREIGDGDREEMETSSISLTDRRWR